ncbi:MAG TPA: pilus assembly protein TadG-related protein [Acidimicrobiia bacterium]|nr:pilus assembly protein TadG-related protein [Acidimicrobiia bacterium]
MSRSLREKRKDDRGAALVFVAISLVLLMGMAAFGTDLAWFYLNAARIQRAADAAALAGVVWLPGEPTTADNTAFSIANQNGYGNGVDNAIVLPEEVAGEENQLQVTIDDTVPTFFLKVLGFDSMTISRSAIAEYIPPLKLGSPSNQFGNACDPDYEGDPGFPADCGDNFWANIHGWFTHTSFGDAFAGHCQGGSNDDENCPANEIARDTGYLYGIEASGNFTLQFVDLAFHNTSGGVTTADQHRTGDRGCEDWGPSTSASCGPTMIVNLYSPDPTPLDLTDNGAPVCTATIPPAAQIQEQVAGNGVPYSWQTPSGAGCWTQSGTGIWVAQVLHQYPGATNDRAGLNRYSVRSTTGKLFALGDFSIYNNSTGSTTAFHLAEVPDFYAGKTFVVEMFDPGEFTSGTGALQVMGPDGSIWNDGECRKYARPVADPDGPWALFDTIAAGSQCIESTTPSEYNNRWLKFEIDLPPTYTCNQAAGACWWKINYVYPGGSSVQDTTTWRAYMIGNPIHLVS